MRDDLFGTTRVAVVRDDLEKSQARMHLDCIFNIVGDDVCLLAEDVIGEESPYRRMVDEYERDVRGISGQKISICVLDINQSRLMHRVFDSRVMRLPRLQAPSGCCTCLPQSDQD